MVVPKGMNKGLNGDLVQPTGPARNPRFGAFPGSEFAAILWHLVTMMIGWEYLEKVSRQQQKSTSDVFGMKELSEQMGSPTTFGVIIFIQSSRRNLARSRKGRLRFLSSPVALTPIPPNHQSGMHLPQSFPTNRFPLPRMSDIGFHDFLGTYPLVPSVLLVQDRHVNQGVVNTSYT